MEGSRPSDRASIELRSTTQGPFLALIWCTAATVVVLVLAALASVLLSPDQRAHLYGDEGSVIEQASTVLWVIAAFAIPIILRSVRPTVLAGIGVALVAAAREADWHVELIEGNVLKIRYYLDATRSIPARMLSAAVVAIVAALCVIVAIALWRRAVRAGGLRRAWVQITVFVMALGITAKLIDSVPGPLARAGWAVPPSIRAVMGSMEEHLELLLPSLVIVGVIAYARSSSPGEPKALLGDR